VCYERAILIGVRNTILIVDALLEFLHSLREAVFLFQERARRAQF
jgi:hypothetical protein